MFKTGFHMAVLPYLVVVQTLFGHELAKLWKEKGEKDDQASDSMGQPASQRDIFFSSPCFLWTSEQPTTNCTPIDIIFSFFTALQRGVEQNRHKTVGPL